MQTKPSIVYLNGKFLPEDQAYIPVSDRGFLFGDGVFTTIKVAEGRPCWLDEHLKKLERDCDSLGMVFSLIEEDVVKKLILENGAERGIWRLKIIITGGSAPGLNLEQRGPGELLMTLKPYSVNKSPWRLTVYPFPGGYPYGSIKSLAYLERLRIADYALKQGYDDAVVLDQNGIVLETSIANLFWKVGKEVFYPDSALLLYHGVTIQTLLTSMERVGLKVTPVKVVLRGLPDEANLFLCNSMKGVVPVTAVDGRTFSRDLEFEAMLQGVVN